MKLLNPVYDSSDELCSFKGVLFKTVVKDNVDPLHFSRVRVDLGKWTDGIPEDKLPWAFPLHGIRGQEFPKVNEKVLVVSLTDDLSVLLYSVWPGNIEFNDQNLHGFVDYHGSLFLYNASSGEYVFHHKSGAKIEIDSSNTIKAVGSNIMLSATDTLTIKAQQLNLHCTTYDLQANTSINEATVMKTISAAGISENTSPPPKAEPPEPIEQREVQQ